MIALYLFLDADGMLNGTPPEKIIVAEKDMKIGVLSGGMISGKPSVSFGIELADGRVVFAETSYALFMTAAKAFAARYGWPDEHQA